MKLKQLIKNLLYSPIVSPTYVLFTLCRDSNISLWKILKAKKRNYLFMIAMHNNAGDLAQTVCINEWLYRNYPESVTINVAYTSPNDRIVKNICKKVRQQDNVFIHSGFNITDICGDFYGSNVFKTHKIILESLPKHQIVFFPQSVEYKDIKKWNQVKEMYGRHNNIIFISRDYISQKYAKELLPYAKHLAYPDVVTTWIGQYEFKEPVKDILLCLRTGEESIINNEQKDNIYRRLSTIGSIGANDTDVTASAFRYRGHRKEVVLEKIKEFSQYKVIVTDRYHGVIFSLVCGRPVVVLKTKNQKVTSAIKWFPEGVKRHVYLLESNNDAKEIENLTKKILSEDIEPLKSKYFVDEVYTELLKDITDI